MGENSTANIRQVIAKRTDQNTVYSLISGDQNFVHNHIGNFTTRALEIFKYTVKINTNRNKNKNNNSAIKENAKKEFALRPRTFIVKLLGVR